MMKKSIIKQLNYAFVALGLLMGAVFPVFAEFFVEWKEGMYPLFYISCLVAGLVIGIANYKLMTIVLLNKLEQVSVNASAISNKDLTQRCELDSEDFLGRIANSFNLMSASLSQSFTTLSQLSNEMADNSKNVLVNADDINQLSETQRISIEGLHASVNTINEGSGLISDKSLNASEISASSESVASSALEQTDLSLSNTQKLVTNISATKQAIEKLASDCVNIGTVLDVIKGIAEQTNLLALNAAIEAARAGEVGRGFAVVADEVRSLATRTQQSTSEIEEIIANLQSSSNQAVNIINESVSASQATSSQAQKTGEEVQFLRQQVSEIAQLNQDINHYIQQQNGEISQITQAIEDVNHSVLKLNDISMKNKASASSLQSISNDVDSIVFEFKV